ncbi:hypothetical protein BJ742DRAFT_765818 [Cladochytrium replicatum]|nr:hypothetical protein BJ742DRAFT_765818 [Cladochytrium replicatum]
MKFGENEAANHVIIEFYASGNIILTDHEYRILSLLRVVDLDRPSDDKEEGEDEPKSKTPTKASKPERYESGGTKFAVGEIYPHHTAQPPTNVSEVIVDSVGKNAKVSKGAKGSKGKNPAASQQQSAKKKELTLKRILQSCFGQDYGPPSIVEHCLIRSRLSPTLKVPSEFDGSADWKLSERAMNFSSHLLGSRRGASSPEEVPEDGGGDLWIQSEFYQYRFAQISELPVELKADPSATVDGSPKQKLVEFDSFNDAVDEFFTQIEHQRFQLAARRAELAAQRKLEAVKAGHENHVQAIEANLQLVDAVVLATRSYLATGMDWIDFAQMLKDEQKPGNQLARVITGLKLEVGMVTVELRHQDDIFEEQAIIDLDAEEDSEDDVDLDDDSSIDGSSKPVKRSEDKKKLISVDIDIYNSAYGNARKYYESKKTAESKHAKTLQVVSKAMKLAEKKIQEELRHTDRKQEQANLMLTAKIRKPYWFEKFLWFISSENYLVVGGRDAQQNEILVRRYLKGDAYVHADLHGAASVIVINTSDQSRGSVGTSDDECTIPPIKKLQAGSMSICQSKAWEAKIVTSTWWVHSHQVSKPAPTGEYLGTGSFMIRGKRNFLPPVPLVYGFGIMFKMDDDVEAVARHYWDRRPWGRGQALEGKRSGKGEENEEAKVTEGRDDQIDEASNDDDEEEAENDPQLDVGAQDNASASDEPPQDAVGGRHYQDQHEWDDRPDDDKDEIISNAGDELNNEAEAGDDNDDSSDMEFPDTIVNLMPIVSGVYGSNPPGEEKDDSDDTKAGTASGKRHLSAKERRDLRKQKQGKAITEPEEVQSTRSNVSGNNDGSKETKQQQPTRGKKGKLRKAKEKYADQDEEERALAMELLAPDKVSQPKGKKAKEAAKKAAQLQQQQQQQQQQDGAQASQRASEKPSKPGLPSNENTQRAIPEKPIDEANKVELENLDVEDIAQDAEQGGDDDDAQDYPYSYLDLLTEAPTILDTIRNAIPVRGPWSAMQRYKYKAKLVPGQLKRGKAAKTIQAAFLAMAGTEAQKETDEQARGFAGTQRNLIREKKASRAATPKAAKRDAKAAGKH